MYGEILRTGLLGGTARYFHVIKGFIHTCITILILFIIATDTYFYKKDLRYFGTEERKTQILLAKLL